MDQKQYRVSEVAKVLHRFIKADLPEDLSLAMIGQEFPGISREQILEALVVCNDEAVLERERSEAMLASMRETAAGYCALSWRLCRSGARNRTNSDAQSVEQAQSWSALSMI